MKKIAVLLPAMRMGGAEKIFLNFLQDLMKYYEVTVVLDKQEGELLCELPEEVKIIENPVLNFKQVFKNDVLKVSLRKIWDDILYYIKVKKNEDTERDYAKLISRMPVLQNRFDCAIAYVGNVSTQIFNLKYRIHAQKKIAWIHGETNELYDQQLFGEVYASFERIYVVSQVSLAHFVEKYPNCAQNVDVYYNRVMKDEIIKKAEEPTKVRMKEKCINIVTVGRLSPEKGQTMIPDIVKKVREQNIPIEWYVIGDGPTRAVINNRCDELKVKSYVHILGTILNPYPYVKQSDIYVQPSFEEGYCTTISEAAILGKPIIGTTSSGGISEQMENEISGLIVEAQVNSLADAIIRLINEPDLRTSISREIIKKDFTNANEIEKLLEII